MGHAAGAQGSREEHGDKRWLGGEDAGQAEERADGGEAGKPEEVVQRGPEEDGTGCNHRGGTHQGTAGFRGGQACRVAPSKPKAQNKLTGATPMDGDGERGSCPASPTPYAPPLYSLAAICSAAPVGSDIVASELLK